MRTMIDALETFQGRIKELAALPEDERALKLQEVTKDTSPEDLERRFQEICKTLKIRD